MLTLCGLGLTACFLPFASDSFGTFFFSPLSVCPATLQTWGGYGWSSSIFASNLYLAVWFSFSSALSISASTCYGFFQYLVFGTVWNKTEIVFPRQDESFLFSVYFPDKESQQCFWQQKKLKCSWRSSWVSLFAKMKTKTGAGNEERFN